LDEYFLQHLAGSLFYESHEEKWFWPIHINITRNVTIILCTRSIELCNISICICFMLINHDSTHTGARKLLQNNGFCVRK
jgi:hypothetical protein